MKKNIICLLIAISIIINSNAQSVAINTDGTSPDASAALDIKSLTKGMLTPRMTNTQRDAIQKPATGLLIYQTDKETGFYTFNGTAWEPVSKNDLPVGAIILSEVKHDPVIESAGFSYQGFINSTVEGYESVKTITSNTWYPINQNDPGQTTNPPGNNYMGSFWDGKYVFGITFSTRYNYDPVTDEFSTEALTKPTFFGSTFSPEKITFCDNYIILTGDAYLSAVVGYKLDLTTKTWSQISKINAPSQRVNYSQIWTGSTLMIWGGNSQYPTASYLGGGGIYNPTTDSWTTIAYPNPLKNIRFRSFHSAVWTGTKMLCWGGYREDAATGSTTHCATIPYDKPTYYNDAFTYDPSTGDYYHITSIGAEGRTGNGSVWAGNQMVIWGGRSHSITPYETEYVDYNYNVTYDCSTEYSSKSYKSGFSYTPPSPYASNLTNMNSPSGLPESEGAYLIYNGSKVIAINGSAKLYQYDPVTNTWDLNAIPDCPASISFQQIGLGNNNSIVWTGNKYVVMFNSNNKMYGYALSPDSPVTVNSIEGSVSKKLYLYKKN